MRIADQRTAIELDVATLRQAVGDLVDALVAGDPDVPAHVVPRDPALAARSTSSSRALPQVAIQDVAAVAVLQPRLRQPQIQSRMPWIT